jgi:hypothetical protein
MSPDISNSQTETLKDFIVRLTTGEAEQMPNDETWERIINRIHVTGRIHQITGEVFDYFLEVLPPRWMRGPYFAFAEGSDSLQLFWFRRRQESADTEHFTRKLTDDEIDHFCKLSRIPRDYGGYYGSEY